MQDLGRNKAVVAGTEHDIVLAEANSAVPLKGDFERMGKETVSTRSVGLARKAKSGLGGTL